MAKFFFYSKHGDILSTAQRVQAEGNDVSVYISDKTPGASPGLGLVPIVDDLNLRPDTVVVFDMVGAGNLADSIRQEGWPVIGGGSFNDRIELDRRAGQALLRMAGVPTPVTRAFTDFEEARKHVEVHPSFLVFKPNNNESTALTKVFDNPAELIDWLMFLEKTWTRQVDFILQEKAFGLELSIEGWFNGEDWIFGSFNSTVEEKAFMTGGVGPRIGCAGNVVFFYKHARPALAKRTLLRLTRFLRQKVYRGPIDINTIGGQAIEFTARFGYDAWQTAMGLLDQEVGKLLSDVARGQTRKMRTTFDYGVGVRLSVPPYPTNSIEHLAKIRGRPFEIDFRDTSDFHIGDVMLGAHGTEIAGQDGVVGTMTHHGPSMSDLGTVYDKIRRAKVDEVQYRTDILTHRANRDVLHALRQVTSLEEPHEVEAVVR